MMNILYLWSLDATHARGCFYKHTSQWAMDSKSVVRR